VSATANERTGVLVVRVWVEGDAPPRARLTATDDLAAPAQEEFAASGVDEIVATVRGWLERFVQPGAG
jgi:hypothetical protein